MLRAKQVSFPRLAYLPFLLPRLLNYYAEELIADAETISTDTGYFSFEGVPLKWQLPIGLLYDIYVLSTQDFSHDDPTRLSRSERKAEPFCLMVHFGSQTVAPALPQNFITPTPSVVHDLFINSVKEADFLRSGTAKPIMSLSAADSKLLWSSTQDNDLSVFGPIFASLLPNNTPWRYIPLRIYLPSTSSDQDNAKLETSSSKSGDQNATRAEQTQGQIRVVQSQISPLIPISTATTAGQMRIPTSSQGTPQTIGTALHSLLPSLFPSRRSPILAKPLLHGAVVPMNAVLEEVASKACYADGWVNIVVSISA